MRGKALFAILAALLLAGCGEAERAVGGWDQLDSGYRADCAPSNDEGVLHAWKGGRSYCFRYTIERKKPREGAAVIVAQSTVTTTN